MADKPLRSSVDDLLRILDTERSRIGAAERSHRPCAQPEPGHLDPQTERRRGTRHLRPAEHAEQRGDDRRRRVRGNDHPRRPAVIARGGEARRRTALPRGPLEQEEAGDSRITGNEPARSAAAASLFRRLTHGESVTPGWYAPPHE
jgi:hypothetical protein